MYDFTIFNNWQRSARHGSRISIAKFAIIAPGMASYDIVSTDKHSTSLFLHTHHLTFLKTWMRKSLCIRGCTKTISQREGGQGLAESVIKP